MAAPQERPAPKPDIAIMSLDLIFSALTASSKARGIDAADVLP